MPHVNGFEVINQLKSAQSENPNQYLPILVLTAQRDHPTRLKALDAGAKDFLTKPLEMAEAATRIRDHLEMHLLHRQVIVQNEHLEAKVLERTQKLEVTRLEIIHRLGRAAEYRGNETGMHVIRMSHLCERLGDEEYNTMKMHPKIGAEILSGIDKFIHLAAGTLFPCFAG
jgi:putative two-component system response regulator